jgi:hypothetical protein
MSWLQSNLQTLLPAGLVVAWLAQLLGPSVLRKLKTTSASIWPKIQPHLNAKNLFLPIAALLLAVLPYLPKPTPVQPIPPAKVTDLYQTCADAGRALLADELDKFAGQRFDSLQAKEDALNEKIDSVVVAAFAPMGERIARAIKENKLTELASKIKSGDVNE